MKKAVANYLKKESINMIEKKASVAFWGEAKIPEEMLKEIEKKNSTR